jgi:signal transduction histidine kinase
MLERSSEQTKEDFRELANEKAEIHQEYEKLGQSQQSLIEVNERLAKVNAVSAELMAELEEKNEDLKNLNQRLAQANASSANLMAELEEKNDKLLRTNMEVARANAHAAELMAVVEIKNEEIEKLNRSISKANARGADLIAERDIHLEELGLLNRDLQKEIDQRKLAEEEQARLNEILEEKNEELQQVIYVTSHDLRSPMVNIKGFSGMLKEYVDSIMKGLEMQELNEDTRNELSTVIDEDIPDAIRFIDSSIDKMESLIEGLLRISRIGSATLHKVPLDMGKMVEDINRTFEFRIKDQGVVISIDNLPDCFGDEIQVNQVVSNLFDNALKYLDPERPGTIRISGERLNGRCIYSVEDNGVGIPDEHMEKVFQLFHRIDRMKTKGEGLGLTAVKRILDRNDGRIWVESKFGKGSRFTFSLPSNS